MTISSTGIGAIEAAVSHFIAVTVMLAAVASVHYSIAAPSVAIVFILLTISYPDGYVKNAL